MESPRALRFSRGSIVGYQDVLYTSTTLISIALSACFCIASPFRLISLHSKPTVVYGRKMEAQKMSLIVLYFAIETSLLVMWTRSKYMHSDISVVCASLSMACGAPMLCLSYLEHFRSFQPSTAIAVYLSLVSMCDLTRTCVLWTVHGNTAITALMIVSVVLGFVLVISESWGKSHHVPDKQETRTRPEKFSGIANRIVYFWLNRLFLIGARGRIEFDQLFLLDKHMASERLHGAFQFEYKRQKGKGRFQVIWTLAIILQRPILVTALPRVIILGLNISQPLLTERLLNYLDPAAYSQASVGRGLIGAYALQYVGLAVFTSLFSQLHFRTLTMVRGCLISALNAKMSDLSIDSVEDIQASLTLMSTDMDQVDLGLQRFHDIWANIIQVSIASYLLNNQVGIACVYPIIIVVCCALVSVCTSSWSKKRQNQWMNHVESRISATSSLLSALKEFKMRGLLPLGSSRIQRLRLRELHYANRFRLTIVWNFILAFIPNFLSPVVVFLAFVLKADSENISFDATRAFTSLSILTILTQPLAATLQGIPLLAAALGSLGRIDTFLSSPGPIDIRKFPSHEPYTRISGLKSKELIGGDRAEIELQNMKGCASSPIQGSIKSRPIVYQTFEAFLGWNQDHDVLQNVSITIPKGLLTFIIGPVASGKTALCRALLGEGSCRQGRVEMYARATDLAYCSQTPWLTNNTIRQNIVGFCSHFDSQWYNAVVGACALRQDLEGMAEGDQTIVGNDGTALSGGQRQRISLARAIFSRKSILILDDALSGLDKQTTRHIFDQAIGPTGLVRKIGATVVYTTHANPKFLTGDHFIYLNIDNKTAKEGVSEEIGLGDEDLVDKTQTMNDGGHSYTVSISAEIPLSHRTARTESPEEYPTDKSAHIFYLKSAGFLIIFWPVVFTAVQTVLSVLSTYWIQLWTVNSSAHNLRFWGVYCLLKCLGLVFLTAAAYQAVIVLITKTGSTLHHTLITTVSQAQLSFLNLEKSGKILNHFSQDIELLDRELPFSLINTLINVFTAMGQAILIIVVFPWSGIAAAGCLALLYVLQKFYLRTSRQLRLLDLETKSPLYSNYSETLKGISTLRAYGWQGLNFENAQRLLDRSQQPRYLLLMVQQWLNFVLNMIVACIAVVVASLAVMQKSRPEKTGVAFTMIMSIATMLQQALISWTTFEISLGAIGRIKFFTEHTPQEDQQYPMNPPPDWPLHGQIELKNIAASYSTEAEITVLKGISMEIKAGEKVGICGKSGCGKSSLLQVFLQLLEIKNGQIFVDGINLKDIHPDIIRARFNTIPQDSMSTLGTVAENLDPYGRYLQSDLRDALDTVNLGHLKTTKLSLDVKFEPEKLSGGERQLFALAAATLNKSKVVLMDEATSQVDKETEKLMQNVIRNEFNDSTVIVIAHRLESLLDFDKIVWLDEGIVVDMDTPQALMSRDSRFYQMLKQSGEGGRTLTSKDINGSNDDN